MLRQHNGKIKGSRFLVTGGAGFIGSRIVHRLLAGGAKEIFVIDNLVRGRLENLPNLSTNSRLKFVLGDITYVSPLNKLFKDIDYVFHEAVIRVTHGQDDPRLCHDVLATGTFNVLEACAQNGIKKIILSSSTTVYGEPSHFPMDEDHPFNNISFYGSAKIYTEFLLRSFRYSYGINYVCLRPFNVYGPGMDISSKYQEVIPVWVDAIANHKPVLVHADGKSAYDFTYIDDVVEANILALNSDINEGIFNVGTGTAVSLNELLGKLSKLMHSRTHPIYQDPGNRVRVHLRVADPKKSEELLNFKAKVKLDDGLAKFVRWWKTQQK